MITYAAPESVDWPAIIRDLNAVMSERKIANRVECSPGNINRLKHGLCKDVKYQLGARILALHEQSHGQ